MREKPHSSLNQRPPKVADWLGKRWKDFQIGCSTCLTRTERLNCDEPEGGAQTAIEPSRGASHLLDQLKMLPAAYQSHKTHLPNNIISADFFRLSNALNPPASFTKQLRLLKPQILLHKLTLALIVLFILSC
ncbi:MULTISPECIES: hypothetical protein [unclassified Pseudomonas]|uniref:hypothetical protein n=1 Tax=unclassified Pseudomonas TaxID=196821 RepID=UPI000876DDE2|nr:MULTISPECIES: hypothetical protein [unclassified Pseudomonas]SEJ79068.1 hypothetical protein SAMN03159298_04424 [Pseudomonas sp. NFACC07-1]SFT10068.1 hypothetical protein SAMN03159306_03659 [Pseudomonas sp. NFACC48-1]SCZ38954.1 hypothetical protein SAMN03159405_04072 [Pseudomonas sp. NFACC44-2]SDA77452.1 hypothetical protein SAMN03159429_03739 [Pseudomonas sp. NFACC51]SFI08662.1 hypothetical protein SAMN03159302_03372 [Pseudomonas sp. NFACC54]